jgi:hypothetical protein
MSGAPGKRYSGNTGDRQVNEAIFLLEEEGYVFDQAVMNGQIISYILIDEKTRSAAILLMSLRGYPQTTMAKFTFDEPMLFIGPYHDTAALPKPVTVRAYLESRSADAAAQQKLAEKRIRIRSESDIADPMARRALQLLKEEGYEARIFETSGEIVTVRLHHPSGARAALRVSNDGAYPQEGLPGPDLARNGSAAVPVREYIRERQFARRPRGPSGP